MQSVDGHLGRIEQKFHEELRKTQCSTDRAFAVLLILQWMFCIGCAVINSPRTWAGAESSVHIHLWLAVGFGGLVASLPVALAAMAPGAYVTRFAVASAQALMSGLIIHLMSGRIEAHFHIFGVLAFLSFYRDRTIYLPMVGIVTADHLIRGLLVPETVYGIESPTLIRSLEHAAWVVYETVFLLFGITQSRKELYANCQLQCDLERERDTLEVRVASRTSDLSSALNELEVHMDTLDRVQLRVEFDADGVVTFANSLFGEVLGYAPEEVIGQHHSLLVTPGYDTTQEYKDFWRRLRAGEIESSEFKRIAKDGTERWLSATYSPLVDDTGKVVRIVKYATDVTDRVRASRASMVAARKAQELARLVTESPNEVYIINQANFGFEEVNQGAIEATGYSREDLMDMKPFDVHPELSLERFQELTEPLDRNETSVVDFKSQIQRKDGTTYTVQISLHSAFFNSTPVYVSFVTDVTELEKLEQRLSQAQKLESIGQLAAGVAHEINTPMQFVGDNIEYLHECSDKLFRVVEGYRELLEDTEHPRSWKERVSHMHALNEECRFERIRDEIPGAIEESLDGVQRTVQIVRAMKVFSHPGAKEMKAENVNQLIESTLAISRNRWKFAADVEVDLDPDLPSVPMLASEINQVLLNLIVNASDAIADKNEGLEGVMGNITVRTYTGDDYIAVEVQDDGGGMPKEVQAKVFDPFFTTKDVGKGTGQGLSIAHNVVVNMHGGDIEVESELGEGTTFRILLPLNDMSGQNATGQVLQESEY